MGSFESDKYGCPKGQTVGSESEKTHQTHCIVYRGVNNWTTETPLRLSRTFRNVYRGQERRERNQNCHFSNTKNNEKE